LEVSGQIHAPANLHPGQESPTTHLDTRLGGPQSRIGEHGEEKILDPTRTRTLVIIVTNTKWKMLITIYYVVIIVYNISITPWLSKKNNKKLQI
jgi:hypothetical protein